MVRGGLEGAGDSVPPAQKTRVIEPKKKRRGFRREIKAQGVG